MEAPYQTQKQASPARTWTGGHRAVQAGQYSNPPPNPEEKEAPNQCKPWKYGTSAPKSKTMMSFTSEWIRRKSMRSFTESQWNWCLTYLEAPVTWDAKGSVPTALAVRMLLEKKPKERGRPEGSRLRLTLSPSDSGFHLEMSTYLPLLTQETKYFLWGRELGLSRETFWDSGRRTWTRIFAPAAKPHGGAGTRAPWSALFTDDGKRGTEGLSPEIWSQASRLYAIAWLSPTTPCSPFNTVAPRGGAPAAGSHLVTRSAVRRRAQHRVRLPVSASFPLDLISWRERTLISHFSPQAQDLGHWHLGAIQVDTEWINRSMNNWLHWSRNVCTHYRKCLLRIIFPQRKLCAQCILFYFRDCSVVLKQTSIQKEATPAPNIHRFWERRPLLYILILAPFMCN